MYTIAICNTYDDPEDKHLFGQFETKEQAEKAIREYCSGNLEYILNDNWTWFQIEELEPMEKFEIWMNEYKQQYGVE